MPRRAAILWWFTEPLHFRLVLFLSDLNILSHWCKFKIKRNILSCSFFHSSNKLLTKWTLGPPLRFHQIRLIESGERGFFFQFCRDWDMLRMWIIAWFAFNQIKWRFKGVCIVNLIIWYARSLAMAFFSLCLYWMWTHTMRKIVTLTRDLLLSIISPKM